MTLKEETEHRLAALMRNAQAGDGVAYARLLEDIAPLLRNVIRRRLRFLSIDDIEDLVQNVLLSVHMVRATYDPGRPFLPWLFAIMQNRIADGARRYARSSAHEVIVEHWPVTFFDDEANRAEESYRDPEALVQAIQKLPPGQRDAVEMLKLREMSLKEAAAVSGMSISALKVAVHRAVKTLRKALATEA